MELEERIIYIYLRIDEIYKEETAYRLLRRAGFSPGLSDVEVLTMEIVGEMEGRNGDRGIWQYFQDHWLDWFPQLGSYKNFAKHCANLCWIKQKIWKRLFPATDNVHIIDGIPMPVCHNARAYRSRMLDTVAAWGKCAAKDEHYYGLRGHVVMEMKGFITSFIATPANADERLALNDIIGGMNGLLIGDKGFISQNWKQELAENGVDLQTPLRHNMNDQRPKWAANNIMRVRKSLETTLSVLVDKFNLTKIKAHNIWHFTSKLVRKILAYNFYILLKS